jgi:hypothetical protein
MQKDNATLIQLSENHIKYHDVKSQYLVTGGAGKVSAIYEVYPAKSAVVQHANHSKTTVSTK